MKVGVEIEYWVTDSKGKLTSSQKITENVEFAEQEFVQPLVEIKTEPRSDIDKLEPEIKRKLKELLKQADKLGQNIVPLGTPLNSSEIEMLPSKRGEIQQKIIGDNLQAAKRVAGTHIHFEKQNIKKQINTLTALDPALALTNSSPYYQGEKIAASSRNQVYRYQCYGNFPQHGQLWGYVDSKQEWENRIEQAFQEFTEAAKKKQISEEELNQYFKKENALWTPVRLRKQFPTVEWRAPDTGRIEDVLRMVKEMKEILENKKVSKPSFHDLEQLSKKAINEGIQNSEVKEYLNEVGFSVDSYRPLTHDIDEKEKISTEEARKIRLKYARKLKESVESF